MHPTRERIDTKDGITQMLGNGESLAGLTQLRQERRRWCKERPSELLNEWYVLSGRVFLDKFGQSWTTKLEGDAHWVHDMTLEGRPGLRSTHSSKSIPRNIDSCLHCGGEITTRQLSDIFVGRFDDDKDRLEVWHGECRILWLDEQHCNAIMEAFRKADLGPPALRSLPNQYGETKYYGPWYRVVSTALGDLMIGCRKRVIHLDWERSQQLADVDGRVLFKDEGVTVDKKLVHAWDYDKLAEYLVALRKSLG